MAKSKRLSIEVVAEILFKEGYSQRQFAEKWKNSRHGVQYS